MARQKREVFVMAFAGIWLAGCSSPPPVTPPCEMDVDCPLGYHCLGNVCDRQCVFDADCADGQSCSMRGRCSGASMDGGTTSDASVVCVRALDCDDGVFCNGAERCAPGEPGAGGDGCAASNESACPEGATCSEASRSCVGCEEDEDGDRERSIRCGGDDCDDEDAARFPGNPETCAGDTMHDEDCDPTTFGFRDRDGDSATSNACCNLDDVSGEAHCGPDCDDDDAVRTPGRIEACDLVDNDCDTRIDEDSVRTFYEDRDGDGFGSTTAETRMGCTAPTGFVDNTLDCAPDDRDRNPIVGETRCDMLDDNCNGAIDESLTGAACVTGLAAPCGVGSTACASGGTSCVPSVAPSCVFGATEACTLCGISGTRRCDGCRMSTTCPLPSDYTVGVWAGTAALLHTGTTCTASASSSTWVGGPGPCLFVSGPAVPLPSGRYVAQVEAIFVANGLGLSTRYGVVGGTIHPDDVYAEPVAGGPPLVFDIRFTVPDDACRVVSITMNLGTSDRADLARMTIRRVGDL